MLTFYRIVVSALLVCATPATAAEPPALDERVDAIASAGFERPSEAIVALRQLAAEPHRSVDDRRVLLQAMGSIHAGTGAAAHAEAVAEQLLALARDDPTGRAVAGFHLVRAMVADNAGELDASRALAQSASRLFGAGCAAPDPSSDRACDYYSAWAALALLERHAKAAGSAIVADGHARAALALVEAAGDDGRQSINLGTLSLYAHERGERDAATQMMSSANRMAGRSDDLATRASIRSLEAQLASMRGDLRGGLRLTEEALQLAVRANAPRLQALLQGNLADALLRSGRPAAALRMARRALPVARRYGDVPSEREMVATMGLAKIGTGRIGEGKQDVARVLQLWKQAGANGRQAETLRRLGEALEKAGDSRGAIELYHRERRISAELMRVDREAALTELQIRSDADARKRAIDLLGSENALKAATLSNDDLRQSMWWIFAALTTLGTSAVGVLYGRVRKEHRQLSANEAQLRRLSERDPLTDLANRRHFHSIANSLDSSSGFQCAVLVVDIDHFKQFNDAHGHAAGDQVLVEVAKRLTRAVRSDDLVVRWGGEEFLILAERATPDQTKQIAARVLAYLGSTPIDVGTALLRITASVGYACFPLPSNGLAIAWEQAVSLADAALLTAKKQGRNRAVGITSTIACSVEALLRIAAEFDAACRDGRVALLHTAGPEARDTAGT